MARYFFDTRDGVWIRDRIGRECRDMKSVHRAALICLAHLSVPILPVAEQREVEVVVRDEQNNLVTQLGVQLEIRIH